MVRSYSWLRAHRKLACSFVVLALWITHVAVVFWSPPPSKTSRVSLLFGTIWSKNQTHWAEFNEYQVEIFRGCIPTTNWASQSTAPHFVIENSDLMCCHNKKKPLNLNSGSLLRGSFQVSYYISPPLPLGYDSYRNELVIFKTKNKHIFSVPWSWLYYCSKNWHFWMLVNGIWSVLGVSWVCFNSFIT